MRSDGEALGYGTQFAPEMDEGEGSARPTGTASCAASPAHAAAKAPPGLGPAEAEARR
jgi:hypothetical protein